MDDSRGLMAPAWMLTSAISSCAHWCWTSFALKVCRLRCSVMGSGAGSGFDMRKEYRITEGESVQQLEMHVNRYMQDGWIPIGGVAIGYESKDERGKYDKSWWYSQAMIREVYDESHDHS